MGVGSMSPSRTSVTKIFSGRAKLVKLAPLLLPVAVYAIDVFCDIELISSAVLFAGQHRSKACCIVPGLCAQTLLLSIYVALLGGG